MLACLAGWEQDGMNTIEAGLDCQPASAPLPFIVDISAVLTNLLAGEERVVAGTIAVITAGGAHYPNWRSGTTSLTGGQSLTASWRQHIPALESLLGPNEFELTLVDVTPAPFNQPPYTSSGDTDTAACTVTGLK